jgi:DNA modification methylase
MALAPTLHDRVDVAFLDPPYNAAREHWVYPDPVLDWFGSVVGAEGEDPLRHDKWLSMMYPRLAWLHVLLAESGALFLTLDDHEAHHARVLLDEIFGPENFLTNIAWERTRSPEDTGSPFLESHTHIIAYAKNARTWRPNPLAKKLPTIWDFEETHSVHGSPDSRLRPHGVTSSLLPFVPKPIKLLRRILRVAAGPNALVLDPFAGSGTTARAVLEQNASDGGDRKFILIEADDRAQALIARNLSGAPDAPLAYGFYNLA